MLLPVHPFCCRATGRLRYNFAGPRSHGPQMASGWMRVAPSDRNGSARPRAHDTRGHIAPSRPLSGSRLQLIGHLIVSAITSEGHVGRNAVRPSSCHKPVPCSAQTHVPKPLRHMMRPRIVALGEIKRPTHFRDASMHRTTTSHAPNPIQLVIAKMRPCPSSQSRRSIAESEPVIGPRGSCVQEGSWTHKTRVEASLHARESPPKVAIFPYSLRVFPSYPAPFHARVVFLGRVWAGSLHV
ncbi:hypothetical protein V8E55_006876 [Tylopilus felleus]